jgi:hypothetical protein
MKNQFYSILFVASLFCFVTKPTVAAPPAALDGMFIINEDAWHFYYTRWPEQMTPEDLNAFIDQYAGTKLTHLFLNPNCQRTRFRSQSWEAIWDGDLKKHFWIQNPQRLADQGLDPYAIWIDRCREKKISPWISMRMNDMHDAEWLNSPLHSSFWVNHPQFWRVPNDPSGANWSDRALNYAHPEVWEYHMALVRELFERYDFDGFEADWMRFGWHLTPGKEKEESVILNRFMQEVRKIAREWEKKRGHPIYIAARAPYDPDVAANYGMDALQWAREGSIDLVIPTPRWISDFDIPVERWRERLDADGGHSADVAVAPGIDMNKQAWPGGKQLRNSLADLYAFVASARFRGARNIYLFNWFDPTPTIRLEWVDPSVTLTLCPVNEKDYRTLLEKGIGDEVILHSLRRHPVGYHQVIDWGNVHGKGVSFHIQLPKTSDQKAQFTIPLGPKPVMGKLRLILGLASGESVKEATFSVTLNGKNTKAMPDLEPAGFPEDVTRALQFDCPLKSAKDGINNITVSQKSGAPQKIVWVELQVDPD